MSAGAGVCRACSIAVIAWRRASRAAAAAASAVRSASSCVSVAPNGSQPLRR